MNSLNYRALHRMARLGNLGTLACSLSGSDYRWLIHNVYDLRFPRLGSDRHPLRARRTFDRLAVPLRFRRWRA